MTWDAQESGLFWSVQTDGLPKELLIRVISGRCHVANFLKSVNFPLKKEKALGGECEGGAGQPGKWFREVNDAEDWAQCISN